MKTIICILLIYLFTGFWEQDKKTKEEEFNTHYKGIVYSMKPATTLQGEPIKFIKVYKNNKWYMTLLWGSEANNGLFDYLECGDSIFIEYGCDNVMIKKNKEDFEGERVMFFDVM